MGTITTCSTGKKKCGLLAVGPLGNPAVGEHCWFKRSENARTTRGRQGKEEEASQIVPVIVWRNQTGAQEREADSLPAQGGL